MSERLLTARELAEYLGLSPASVLDAWQRGDLPGFRLFGRKGGPVRFKLAEVETSLEGWRRGPSPKESSCSSPLEVL
jgi:excisionase family DNA binding protein